MSKEEISRTSVRKTNDEVHLKTGADRAGGCLGLGLAFFSCFRGLMYKKIQIDLHIQRQTVVVFDFTVV